MSSLERAHSYLRQLAPGDAFVASDLRRALGCGKPLTALLLRQLVAEHEL